MDGCSDDVPLQPPGLRVGIIYNLKKGDRGRTPDAEAEYDSLETVLAIRDALTQGGADVRLLEALPSLPEQLLRSPIDIAFNIAEGFSGRGREAQIPALLGILGIPYSGSDETTLSVALDKAMTKRLLSTYRIRSPKSVVIEPGAQRSAAAGLRYPLIVKPNAEGSSKGISEVSIVENAAELRALVERNTEMYKTAMLAEEYIDGREFTVGILGNGAETRVFPPMEIVFQKNTQGAYRVYSYTVKQNYKEYIRYNCPAELDGAKEAELMKTARRVYDALGCRDCARIDFRLGQDGRLYFIEVNPLPGLAPGYSDYPMLAEFCGVRYGELVRGILRAAAARCGLAF
jgi:D-alanine-D-alanine ligase